MFGCLSFVANFSTFNKTHKKTNFTKIFFSRHNLKEIMSFRDGIIFKISSPNTDKIYIGCSSLPLNRAVSGLRASAKFRKCDATLCSANHYVSSHVCTTCPDGTTKAAGDDASGDDTECVSTLCSANHYVSSHVCMACPPGTTKAAGDDASGVNTECDATLCGVDEYVSDEHVCTTCPAGTTNAAGDDASGSNTTCDATFCKVNTGVQTVWYFHFKIVARFMIRRLNVYVPWYPTILIVISIYSHL